MTTHPLNVLLSDGELRELVRLGNGTRFPALAWVHIQHPGVWPDGIEVLLRLEVRDGRPVLAALSVRSAVEGFAAGPEISASFVHSLSVDYLVDVAIRAVDGFVTRRHQHVPDGPVVGPSPADARRRRRMTNALLGEVARVTRANPDRPTRAVQEQMFTSYRSASRWIAEARARGFLEEEEEQ